MLLTSALESRRWFEHMPHLFGTHVTSCRSVVGHHEELMRFVRDRETTLFLNILKWYKKVFLKGI